MHSLHAQQREGLGLSDKISILEEFTQETVPFAKIGAVTEGSPAAKAVNTITFYSKQIVLIEFFSLSRVSKVMTWSLALAH